MDDKLIRKRFKQNSKYTASSVETLFTDTNSVEFVGHLSSPFLCIYTLYLTSS